MGMNIMKREMNRKQRGIFWANSVANSTERTRMRMKMTSEIRKNCTDFIGGEKEKQEYAKPELQIIVIATHEILGASDEPAPPGGGDDPWG